MKFCHEFEIAITKTLHTNRRMYVFKYIIFEARILEPKNYCPPLILPREVTSVGIFLTDRFV